jgi:hypothetical protein
MMTSDDRIRLETIEAYVASATPTWSDPYYFTATATTSPDDVQCWECGGDINHNQGCVAVSYRGDRAVHIYWACMHKLTSPM